MALPWIKYYSISLILIPFFIYSQDTGMVNGPNDSALAVTYADLSLSYSLNNNDSALYFAEKSLSLAHQLNDQRLVALALDRKGMALQKSGEWQKAIDFIDRAGRLRIELKQYSEAARSYLDLGNIYKREGELLELQSNFDLAQKSYDNALKHYLKALQEAQHSQDSFWIAHSLLNIGSAHYALYEDQKALINYTRSKSIFQSTGYTDYVPAVDMNMALIYEGQGKEAEALAAYTTARDFFKKKNNLKDWIACNINLAGFYEESNADKALFYLIQADSLAQKLHDRDKQASIQEYLATVYENKGDYRQSLLHYRNYTHLKNTILNMGFKNEELSIRYNTEKQKKDIAYHKAENLKKEMILQQTQAEKKQLVFIMIIALSLAFGIIGFYMWRQRVMAIINRKNEEIHHRQVNDLLSQQELKAIEAMLEGQEKERDRMAEDLHDRLGSTLSAARMQLEAATEHLDELQSSKANKARKLLDKAIDDTRSIAHNISSGVLTRFGLTAALYDLKESVEISDRIKVKLNVKNVDRLHTDLEINLYRIIQELISNSLKHAEAKLIEIDLFQSNARLSIKVADNGKGFIRENVKEGLGLQNIAARVEKSGGHWRLFSEPGKGTIITIEVDIYESY